MEVRPLITYLSLVLYEKLFNALFDERADCKLIKSPLLDVKIQNWNKINATICFNYLQQQFYLVAPTMKALAGGKNQQVIETMIKHLLHAQQGTQFETYLDDEGIRDIAEVVETDKVLYTPEEANILNQSHAIQVKNDKEVRLDDEDLEHLQKVSRRENEEEDDDLSRQ